MSASMRRSSLLLPQMPDLVEHLQAEGMLEPLSDEGVEAAYAQAYYLTQQRQFLSASRLFVLLSLFRPKQPRLWQGLALCARELRAYDDAAQALTRYLELAPQAHEFAFALADCLCLAGHRGQAIETLELMVNKAEAQGADALRQRARSVIARLQGANHEPQH